MLDCYRGWKGRDHLAIAIGFEAVFTDLLEAKAAGDPHLADIPWTDCPEDRITLLSIWHLVTAILAEEERREKLSAAVKRQRRGRRRPKREKPFRLEP